VSGRVARRPLGRGLAELFGETAADPALSPLAERRVPIEAIRPSALQPRRRFAEPELAALAQSIREKGILQPLLVRPAPANGAAHGSGDGAAFELVAGERRWRAAQRAGLHEVPVVVRTLGDAEVLEMALVENLQREELTPLEEAAAYRRLCDEFGRTQASLAEAVGKSRSHIANTMRLLSLPVAVRERLEAGELSAGHARALLTATDPARLADEVVRRGLNVRATERLAQRRAHERPRPRRQMPDADTAALERELGERLGLRVGLKLGARGGTLTLRYQTLDQLDRVLSLLRSA
jgi:ParB family transcriptional regulator, chromosome partitioning protein